MAANTADLNGGGVYVAEGRGCATYAQCYTVQLDNVSISGERQSTADPCCAWHAAQGVVHTLLCALHAACIIVDSFPTGGT